MSEFGEHITGMGDVGINNYLTKPRYFEQSLTQLDLTGVSVGRDGILGEDALHIHKTESEALVVARSNIEAINVQREQKGQQVVIISDPRHFPFGVIELSASDKGQVYFKPTVQGDISIMAWFPGLAKRIVGGNARVVYFDPGMNRRIVYQPHPIPVPKGTMIIAATDGGIRSLFKPSVLKAGGIVLTAADHEELEKTAISIDTPEITDNISVAKRDFNRLTHRLLGLLDIHNSDESIRKMAQDIAGGDTGADDATIVFCRVKK